METQAPAVMRTDPPLCVCVTCALAVLERWLGCGETADFDEQPLADQVLALHDTLGSRVGCVIKLKVFFS